jgi:hypothetical protein
MNIGHEIAGTSLPRRARPGSFERKKAGHALINNSPITPLDLKKISK